MQAVQSLCKTAIYLKSGQIADIGVTEKVINNYLSREVKNCISARWDDESTAPGNEFVRLISAKLDPKVEKEADAITVATAMDITFEFVLHKDCDLNLSLFLNTPAGLCIFNVSTAMESLKKGFHSSKLSIPARLLNDDIYTIKLFFVKDASTIVFAIDDILTFEVVDEPRKGNWYGKWEGAIRPTLPFTLT
jgi:lipopolysaccharide transport system ATP-binding protein